MKKKSARILALTLALTSALALTGCGTEAGADDTTIRVGASPAPHAEVLEVIADNLEEEGYTLEIVEYNDYILPNTGVSEGDLDANYFQTVLTLSAPGPSTMNLSLFMQERPHPSTPLPAERRSQSLTTAPTKDAPSSCWKPKAL